MAFIILAWKHPGHFRLMFRNDLVDRSDPRYTGISEKPGMRLGRVIFAYRGRPDVDLTHFADAADMLSGLSTLHGLAHLVLQAPASVRLNSASCGRRQASLPPEPPQNSPPE